VKIRKQGRTLEGRLTVATVSAENALAVFDTVADQLEAAAEAAKEVGDAAEVERLAAQAVRDEADRKRVAYTAKASKLRDLLQ